MNTTTTSANEPLINVAKPKKILAFSMAAFILTIFMINKQRHSPYILNLASDRALAGRALLLGTAAACSGVGILVGTIATLMNVESFREFRMKTDSFFIRHGIKSDLSRTDSNLESDVPFLDFITEE